MQGSALASFSPRGALVKREGVGPPGEVDYDPVVSAFGSVILGKLPAEASSLYPNRGIQVGIKVVRATEDLCCNLIFLRGNAGMLQGLIR
jgi:hypothetical protein